MRGVVSCDSKSNSRTRRGKQKRQPTQRLAFLIAQAMLRVEPSSILLQSLQALGASIHPARPAIHHQRLALDVGSPHVTSMSGRKAHPVAKLRPFAAHFTHCHVEPPKDVAPLSTMHWHREAAAPRFFRLTAGQNKRPAMLQGSRPKAVLFNRTHLTTGWLLRQKSQCIIVDRTEVEVEGQDGRNQTGTH